MAFLKDKLPKPASTPGRLIITLKQSARRCLYRHWEGKVVGREVRTKTVELERMSAPLPYRQSPHCGQSLSQTGQAKGSGQKINEYWCERCAQPQPA